MDESTIRGMKSLELKDLPLENLAIVRSSRNFAMDESTIRELKSLDLKDRESSDAPLVRDVRFYVGGYDPSLGDDEIKSALTKHFRSCGEIRHIYMPSNERINRALICIRGVDVEKKAFDLNGSDMGGWDIKVKFPKLREAIPRPHFKGSGVIDVVGYDTSLSVEDVKTALNKHFSSCGENKVVAYIEGEGAVEKALKLSGCECDVKECKIVAKKYIRPKIRQRVTGGSTVPDSSTKKAKMAKV